MDFKKIISKLENSTIYQKREFAKDNSKNNLFIYIFNEDEVINENDGILVYQGEDTSVLKEFFSIGYKSKTPDKPYVGIAIRQKEVILVHYNRERKIRKNLSKISPRFLIRLEKFIEKPNDKNSLEELFDRKDLIDEFYQLYKLSRSYVVSNLKGQFGSEEEKYDYADNLLLTILTLWFLQERNFFNNDPNYFINLFIKKQEGLFQSKESFFDMLRRLFLEIEGHSSSVFVESAEFGKLVVLGPALFLYKDFDKKSINLPDEVFYKPGFTKEILLKQPKQLQANIPIFNLMESRDWTEGNLDEYVIGAIYEKLIDKEERKRTGANYTPEEITTYMAKNTIEPWFLEQILEKTKIQASNVSLAIEEAKAKDIPILFSILQKVKICDPAVGSAHYLESCIDVLVELYEKIWRRAVSLEIKQGLEIKTASSDGKIISLSLTEFSPLKTSDIEAFRLHVKFFIILSRNLYGVDINSSALRVARARLFLSLAKHFDLQEKRFIRFPNVHFNLKYGNSLVGFIQIPKLENQEAFEYNLFTYSQKEASSIVNFLEEELKLTKNSIQTLQEALGLEGNLVEELQNLKKIFANTKITNENYKQLIQTKSKLTAICIASLSIEDAIHLKNLLTKLEFEFKKKLDKLFSEKYNFELLALQDAKTFHWEFEFPEVFHLENGFDIIVGNPPYLGGKKLKGALGREQREYFVNYLAKGKRGSADLAAYFYLRSVDLLKSQGFLGYLSTNTTSQGDTREVGLDQILSSGVEIIRAKESFEFPGDAVVHVVMVFLYKGKYRGKKFIVSHDFSQREVNFISAYLKETEKNTTKPYRLKANQEKSFQGANVLGLGFTLTPEQDQKLIDKNPKNQNCIYPYLSGEDLNSSPTQTPSRFIINFFDWPLSRKAKGSWFKDCEKKIIDLELKKAKSQKFTGKPSDGFTFYEDPEGLPTKTKEMRKQWLQAGIVPSDYPYPVAEDYPDLLEIVKKLVKPERDQVSDARAKHFWWRYFSTGGELYSILQNLDRVLVKTRYSPHVNLEMYKTNVVYQESVVVIPIPDFSIFAIFTSCFHEIWAWENGSTLRTDLRYSPTDCFETFPFPNCSEEINFKLEEIGKTYHELRKKIMLQNKEGLTKTYNRFNNPEDLSLVELRELHVKMDNLVKEAYGWSEIDLKHDFYNTKLGIRFTICEQAKAEILKRLFELNYTRFQEEKAEGLWNREIQKGKIQ